VTAASSTLESPDQTTILKANRPHTAHFNLIAQPSPPAPLSVVRQEMCSVARVCVCARMWGVLSQTCYHTGKPVSPGQ